MNIGSWFGSRTQVLAGAGALAVAALALPAMAGGCYSGWGGGFSFGYSSCWDDGCVSIGVSSPVYVYASGPRYYRYYDDCRPSYRHYYRPSPRYYYHYDYSPRYYRYHTPSYRRYYRSYDSCGYYSWTGEAIDGGYVASAGPDESNVRFRGAEYAGDPTFAPDGFKVVSAAPSGPEQFDPDWAGDAVAMLRKGRADDAIVALRGAAQPASFSLQPSTQASAPANAAPSGTVSDLTFDAPASSTQAAPATGRSGATALGQVQTARTDAAIESANPEALRLLGLALIADGQMDEGAARILAAYQGDISLVNSPIDERMFPSSARFTIRDLIRKLSVRANQTNAPEAWFALGVLMQAEGRNSVALDMVIKASGAGLGQDVVSPMADALRRVVYGRG